jgi:hypothetical protein
VGTARWHHTPLGFTLPHLAGSTSRLLTYGRGEPLSDAQREQLSREKNVTTLRPSLDALLVEWHSALEAAVRAAFGHPRSQPDGRAHHRQGAVADHGRRVCVFTPAEHAGRHAGQVVTTAKLVRALLP